jgi:hypothetical protein
MYKHLFLSFSLLARCRVDPTTFVEGTTTQLTVVSGVGSLVLPFWELTERNKSISAGTLRQTGTNKLAACRDIRQVTFAFFFPSRRSSSVSFLDQVANQAFLFPEQVMRCGTLALWSSFVCKWRQLLRCLCLWGLSHQLYLEVLAPVHKTRIVPTWGVPAPFTTSQSTFAGAIYPFSSMVEDTHQCLLVPTSWNGFWKQNQYLPLDTGAFVDSEHSLLVTDKYLDRADSPRWPWFFSGRFRFFYYGLYSYRDYLVINPFSLALGDWIPCHFELSSISFFSWQDPFVLLDSLFLLVRVVELSEISKRSSHNLAKLTCSGGGYQRKLPLRHQDHWRVAFCPGRRRHVKLG